MRSLRIIEHISLDGVIQHSADDTGFAYSDWTVPYRTPAGREEVIAAHGADFDLLLGRRTYDIWSGFWPAAPAGPFTERINAATKYVATHRAASLVWGPSVAIGPDLAGDIARIKAQGTRGLVLSGSSTLTSPLLAHGLVDELLLIVYPVLLGSGKRIVADATPARGFALTSSKALPSGVVLNRYVAGDVLARHSDQPGAA